MDKQQFVLEKPVFANSEILIKELSESTKAILAKYCEYNQKAKTLQESIRVSK